jgi:hypothetical protein
VWRVREEHYQAPSQVRPFSTTTALPLRSELVIPRTMANVTIRHFRTKSSLGKCIFVDCAILHDDQLERRSRATPFPLRAVARSSVLTALPGSPRRQTLWRDFVRIQENLPVWLVGASQGATAAAGAAARLGGKIAGVVVMSSVTGRSSAGETLFDSELGRITVPVLIVANNRDSCPGSPPNDAPKIAGLSVAPPFGVGVPH